MKPSARRCRYSHPVYPAFFFSYGCTDNDPGDGYAVSGRVLLAGEPVGNALVSVGGLFETQTMADGKSAQMFTIAHELAHIWIGKSAGFDLRKMQPSDNDTEKFCDTVAAEFLVPEELFRKQLKAGADFQRLAKVFKVSPIVVARKALDLGAVNRDEFFDFYNDHVSKYALISEKKSDGGDFNATLR